MIEVLQFGLSSNKGGIETYLEKIWKNIDQSMFHFSFIDMTGEANLPCFYEEFLSSGCKFYKVTPRSQSVLKNHRDIKTIFGTNQFDILHFNVNTLSYLYPVEVAIEAGSRVIIHSRSSGSLSGNNKITKLLHGINKERLKQMNVTRIAVSDKAGRWLFGSTDYQVLNNGVDTIKFSYNPIARDLVRQRLGIEGKTVIGHVGAFFPVKNHTFVIDVFRRYLSLNPNSVLLLVGEGPSIHETQRYVSQKGLDDDVFFLGRRSDLPELYSAMDLLLLPSLFEGFPNVILEAQSMGLPCIISDRVTSEVKIFDSCLSMGLEDALLWAHKIDELIRFDIDREKASQTVDQKGYSVQKEIERIEALYRSVL